MSSETPERDPNMEPDPGSEFAPDPEESTGDPMDPVPTDGRGGQPAEGSSDDAAMMEEGDPLHEAGYAEAEELPFVEEEVEDLEDQGELSDPEADRLANASIDEEEDEGLDRVLAADAGDDVNLDGDPDPDDDLDSN
ncbi:MAG: hypothetical protein ACTHWW_05840 [Arthrobacter sp.]|uniref:hypothetical protein n=1 Tax=Arthrobacter TaxID=1663 RepID=UPI00265045FF|nr:hypothetical protein [Micrococcaceae bacterium]MDN5812601.1 hypothetical protein [Micrococcaceae bacterium]MDN5823404.1 hypothetical protein [Micrococcaceae bacterium]MDN5878699.1 hypothetical protein [Micrococcaceae bacterium]MDN5886223.1 hypothetical protein [Micrococcaceae bacterium]